MQIGSRIISRLQPPNTVTILDRKSNQDDQSQDDHRRLEHEPGALTPLDVGVVGEPGCLARLLG